MRRTNLRGVWFIVGMVGCNAAEPKPTDTGPADTTPTEGHDDSGVPNDSAGDDSAGDDSADDDSATPTDDSATVTDDSGTPTDDSGETDDSGKDTGTSPPSEICYDGVDNDGDTEIDEGCVVGEVSLGDADASYAGDTALSMTGYIVSAGDANGDGLSDLLIGMPSPNSTKHAGSAALLLGPIAGELDVDDASAVVSGAAAAQTGSSALISGDLDGDGYGDIVVGEGASTESGSVFGFLGPVSGDIDVSTADFALLGPTSVSALGRTLTAGDFDGDGLPDLVVSGNGDGTSSADAYLFAGGSPKELSDATLEFYGAGSLTTTTIVTRGDLDGDGTLDLVVGRPGENDQLGSVVALYGPVAGTMDESDADVSLHGSTKFEGLGYRVDANGDADGDGKEDLLVSAVGGFEAGAATETGDGAAHLFFGPGPATGDTADADASWYNEAWIEELGTGLSFTDDYDGDGGDEVLIGSPGRNSAYLFFGPFVGIYAHADAVAHFSGVGSSDAAGMSVGSAGDMDGDGTSEIYVGAVLAGGGMFGVGSVAVFDMTGD